MPSQAPWASSAASTSGVSTSGWHVIPAGAQGRSSRQGTVHAPAPPGVATQVPDSHSIAPKRTSVWFARSGLALPASQGKPRSLTAQPERGRRRQSQRHMPT